MYNIFYIILSFITIILTYYIQNRTKQNNDILVNPNLKSKIKVLKKKFNIKSSETSFKKQNDSINKIRKNILLKTNTIDVLSLPLNSSTSEPLFKIIPIHLINKIKNNFNKKKVESTENFDLVFKPILTSFINSKITYYKIFEPNGKPIINDINNFISIYKNIVTTKDKYIGYNIVIKLYNEQNNINEYDEKYVSMKKNTLIKINNTSSYKDIDNILSKNKIFLITNKNQYYISYGNSFNSDINSEQIKDIFFNKVNLSNEKIYKNYQMFCKFKKITFIYWVATPILFT